MDKLIDFKKEDLESTAAAEVGNIFTLKYKYSEPLGLDFNDKDGKRKTVFMGCYGIGVSRVMGVITEKYADDKGLIWPANIAPYKFYIIPIGNKASEIAEKLHNEHPDDIILDDRDFRPGQKFADAELMGIPYRIVISDKTLENNECEITYRATGQSEMLPLEIFPKKFAQTL